MRVAVTGPSGFLAWHVRCALMARTGHDAILIHRQDLADRNRLMDKILSADAVIHLAGVNRALTDAEILEGNTDVARRLAQALSDSGRSVPVVHANSIHARGESVFGESKRIAAQILRTRQSGPMTDVFLPNIFGEHGRPHYNSFVATFCHLLATGEEPTVSDDRELSLLHAQDAADVLIDAACAGKAEEVSPAGTPIAISAVLNSLQEISELYRKGRLPNTSTRMTRSLFNTYRSYALPHGQPPGPEPRLDERGVLVEAMCAQGGEAQVFYSTTRPGFTRGQHFHRRKFERFLVMSGQAEVRLRRLGSSEVVSYRVSGAEPAIVDMPTMWAHSITNVGDSELMTLFYADQIFDPTDSDTFAQEV